MLNVGLDDNITLCGVDRTHLLIVVHWTLVEQPVVTGLLFLPVLYKPFLQYLTLWSLEVIVGDMAHVEGVTRCATSIAQSWLALNSKGHITIIIQYTG